jgi:hypothetical protein
MALGVGHCPTQTNKNGIGTGKRNPKEQERLLENSQETIRKLSGNYQETIRRAGNNQTLSPVIHIRKTNH